MQVFPVGAREDTRENAYEDPAHAPRMSPSSPMTTAHPGRKRAKGGQNRAMLPSRLFGPKQVVCPRPQGCGIGRQNQTWKKMRNARRIAAGPVWFGAQS